MILGSAFSVILLWCQVLFPDLYDKMKSLQMTILHDSSPVFLSSSIPLAAPAGLLDLRSFRLDSALTHVIPSHSQQICGLDLITSPTSASLLIGLIRTGI